jgi:hypothetical protein
MGDWAVVRWTHHWQNDDGGPGHVRGVDGFRVRDGKVAQKSSYVKGQPGAVIAGAAGRSAAAGSVARADPHPALPGGCSAPAPCC